MAEWVGFEPTHACAPNDLANRPLEPLEYHSVNILLWRRGWDSNPRSLSESLVFKTSSLNRSDTSPCLTQNKLYQANYLLSRNNL